MIVAMQESATDEQIQQVVEHLVRMGFSVHRTTGERQTVLAPRWSHPNGIGAAAFRHDGLAVALGSSDRTAQIWDPTTWTPIGPAMQHDGEVNCVTFHPKGDLLSIREHRLYGPHLACGDRQTHRSRLAARQDVTAVSCSPDGRIVGTISDDYSAGLWAMPRPVTDDPDQVWRWAQRITGLTLSEDDAFHVLSPKEFAELAPRS